MNEIYFEKSLSSLGVAGRKNPRVVVIDSLLEDEAKTIDIDGDGSPCVSHGRVVRAIIESVYPGIEIIPENISPYSMKRFVSKITAESEVIGVLEKILAKINNGEQIDAINISAGAKERISDLARKIGIANLNGTNLLEYKLTIRQWLSKEHPEQLKSVSLIEEIIEKGTEVFISAGNKPQDFNLYSLARGAHVIGATNAVGVVAPYSACNSLVTDLCQGTFSITKIKQGGVDGYDVIGNGQIAISHEEVSKEGAPIIELFIGKNYHEVAAVEADYALLQKAVIPTDKLSKFGDVEAIKFIEQNPRLFSLEELYKRNLVCLDEY